MKEFANGVTVGRCNNCGLVYTPQRLARPEASFGTISLERLRIYNEPLTSGRFENYRTAVFRRYLATIAEHAPGKRLLDVGCAQGFFLDEARRAGYETTGIEPSPAAAAFAREELGLDVRDGRADQVSLGAAEFDVVTMTDALEYLPNPVADLKRITAHLSPGGLFFAKVPNGDYFVLRRRIELARGRTGGSGGAFSPPGRVAHYTAQTLPQLMASVGLDVLNIGGFTPIDSPSWHRLTGLPLAIRPPWYFGLTDRIARRALHAAGLIEQRLSGNRNHLSQSIAVLARRNGA
jgi:2-polyprenyl-3-methyl-5-hydroxy-6-metoxy-1,4-benzoquinol methylase